MIRTFCDCCGSEITDANTTACGNKGLGRLKAHVKVKIGGTGEVMAVEVITAHEGTWNKGHFCKYCVIDAINTLDDRPRAAAQSVQPDVKAMVNRFLGWRLPETFSPDCYVSFDCEKAKANHGWPIGTNLLNAEQARAMFEYVLGSGQ